MSLLQVSVGKNKTLSIDLSLINQGEGRLFEVSMVNPVTANELCAFFNGVASKCSFELGKLEFEILSANKQYDLAKATVILDVAPIEAEKLKEKGLKANDAWRDALICRDTECRFWKDIIDQLEAVKGLLATKLKSFERAYYVCYKEKDRKVFTPDTKINGYIGETSR